MISVVVPTVGRPSLGELLAALDVPDELIIVDDRCSGLIDVPPALRPVTHVLAGPGRGPAAARNVGWRSARSPWVAFLDDDVVPSATWLADLHADIAAAGPDVVGVQGRIDVPLPAGRRATDWERGTAGLATARWITADMAYRRDALAAVGGFDERFPRAFREDADLAARLRLGGGSLVVGTRRTTHPVRREGPWVSLRTQAGNADDALLRRLYGSRWRERLEIPPGRRARHAFVVGAGVVGMAGAVGARWSRSRSRLAALAAVVGGLLWLAGAVEFTARRVAPGPRTPREVVVMAVTSALIPPLAIGHWLRGWWHWRRVQPVGARPTRSDIAGPRGHGYRGRSRGL